MCRRSWPLILLGAGGGLMVSTVFSSRFLCGCLGLALTVCAVLMLHQKC